jgi:hypothetical protein
VRPTAFRIRLGRLEASQEDTQMPNLILSSCPMPDDVPTAGVIDRWLDDGMAHVAFKGRAILYDGGETEPFTEQQWQHRYCGAVPS